jgi:outer membrane lipoprotein SlyB
MKKYITSFLMVAMVAIMIPFMSVSADAQTRRSVRSSRTYSSSNYDRPNFYQRHRNAINVGIGGVAGAVLGGLIGGKKGALIGTAAGAGGAALYTYKLNPKTKKYYRVYNNRRY